jgi:uncharacterized protein YajQ (UPF0234 family)
LKVKVGIDQDLGKKIVKLIKESKLKAQAASMGDVRPRNECKERSAAGNHHAR